MQVGIERAGVVASERVAQCFECASNVLAPGAFARVMRASASLGSRQVRDDAAPETWLLLEYEGKAALKAPVSCRSSQPDASDAPRNVGVGGHSNFATEGRVVAGAFRDAP